MPGNGGGGILYPWRKGAQVVGGWLKVGRAKRAFSEIIMFCVPLNEWWESFITIGFGDEVRFSVFFSRPQKSTGTKKSINQSINLLLASELATCSSFRATR